MPIITDIVRQKKNKGYYSIFVDGNYLFSISTSDLNFLNLKINDDITKKRLDELIRIYSLQKAKDYAYNLLSRKSYSRIEMKDKLLNRFPQKVTDQVIKDLISLEYINDEKIIKEYAINKIQIRPMGPWKLRQDLIQRKFDLNLVEKTIQELFQQYDEFELAEKVFEKKYKNLASCNDIKFLNKIKNYLLSNGFNMHVVLELINIKLKD